MRQFKIDGVVASPQSHPPGAAVNREPLDVPLREPDGQWSRRIEQATWAFVTLGIVVRLLRYALRFPLWGDECFVAVNFLDRGYLDLLRPLDYGQVCPPLFLWIELATIRLLGFNEWSLRLFPCLCGVASVVLFRHVAGRLLRGVPLLLAVAVFAVSYYLIRHGAEVKPYASDLAVSLMLLALVLEWWREPAQTCWLWALVVAAPIALAMSHPAVFVAGGISMALLPSVLRVGARRHWIPFAVYNTIVPVAFLVLFTVFTGAQYDAAFEAGRMGAYWSAQFPPLTDAVRLLVWMIETHTGQMLAYPLGGGNGGSTLTFVCFAVGLIALCRRRQWTLSALLLAPFGLTFVAAAMERYPYGGSARVSLYLAPIICLLAGLGAAAMLSRIPSERVRRRVLVGSGWVLAALGVGMMTSDLVQPFKTSHDLRLRDFARWFWTDKAYDAELVCVRTDLGQRFFPKTYAWRGLAQYMCNQRIYSARHRRAEPPHWELVSATHPLRCVAFSLPDASCDEAAFSTWLDEMKARFTVVNYEKHDFHKFHEHGPPDRERIELFEFVPCGDTDRKIVSLAHELSVEQTDQGSAKGVTR